MSFYGATELQLVPQWQTVDSVESVCRTAPDRTKDTGPQSQRRLVKICQTLFLSRIEPRPTRHSGHSSYSGTRSKSSGTKTCDLGTALI